MAVGLNPFAVGMGLDEDTAAFISPDDVIEVRGSGGITVVDPSALEYSSTDQTAVGHPVTFIGVKLHILTRGTRFDLRTRDTDRTHA
jgi:cyanophycinase